MAEIGIHGIAVLLLTVGAFVSFAMQRVPIETTALVVIAALALGFALFPYETAGVALKPASFFLGFGHEALVAICGLMILGQGLTVTGALEPVARRLSVLLGKHPRGAMLLVLVVGGIASGFINDTPVVMLMLPILTGAALRSNTPPGKMLMPANYAVLIGGMGTTIGTSTNLLVVSVAADMGLKPLGMFDFVLPAAMAGAVGVAFLCFIAPRLLPGRSTPLTDTSRRVFTAQLRIRKGSFAEGKTLSQAVERAGGEMRVVRIQRGSGTYLVNFPDALLRADDRLLLTDTPQNLKQFETALGGTLYSGDVEVDEEHPLTAEDQQISEVVVVQGSTIEGSTLKQLQFVNRYQLVVIALHRAGKEVALFGRGVGDVRLRAGDVLLVTNVGGFSANRHLSAMERQPLLERLVTSLGELQTPGVEIIPQTMPPFPWHFGGQCYHNLFVDADCIENFCRAQGLRVCLDVSHSKLACNHLHQSFSSFLERILPLTAHLHLADAAGVDGEGLQIDEGDIDWANVFNLLQRLAPAASFIPEIWQGHKNNGEGAWLALERLEHHQLTLGKTLVAA